MFSFPASPRKRISEPICLTHNVWSGGALPVLATLVGWLSLIKALIFLLLSPEVALIYFQAPRNGQFFWCI
jgi:hypothetical protein